MVAQAPESPVNDASLSLKERLLQSGKSAKKLFIGLGIVAAVSNLFLVFTSSQVDHTHTVIHSAEEILGTAVDMETGMRGYLLAGDPAFLEPYERGAAAFDEMVAELQATVDDNPEQVARLGEARTLINDWERQVVEPFLQMRRDIGDARSMNDLGREVAQARGKAFFDDFRAKMALFIQRESTLMETRMNNAAAAEQQRQASQAVLSEAIDWVDHTQKVLNAADRIVMAAVDMETGLRGFLLAGRDEFLEPYEAGQQELAVLLAQLQETVSDNPAQVAVLEQAATTITDWREQIAEPMIGLKRESLGEVGGAEKVASEVAKARGKTFFDAFRQQMATFRDNERQLLAERRVRAAQAEEQRTASQQLLAETSEWVEHTGRVIAAANQIVADAVNMETGVRGFLLAGKEEFLEPFHTGRERFDTRVAALQQTVDDNPPQVQLLGEAKQVIDDWYAQVLAPQVELRRAISGSLTMDDVRDQVKKAEGKTYFDAFRQRMAAFVDVEKALMERRKLVAWIAVVASLLVIGIGIVIAVRLGTKASLAMASTISHSIEQVVDLLRRNSSQVQESSEDVQMNSQKLATSATQQAASLEETSATVEEFTRQLQTSEEHARHASHNVGRSGERMAAGAQAMTNMVTAMREINDSSQEVIAVIQTIRDIAFQTNLLALNAAVEAARAGEAGAGFAVVAEEVRILAQRCSEAAKNSSELIEGSIEKVTNGSRLAEDMGEQYAGIQAEFQTVTDLVEQILASSQEQAEGITQINLAVGQLDELTQSNAASAEQSANQAVHLSAQAQDLSQSVSRLVALVTGGRGQETPAAVPSATQAEEPQPAARDYEPVLVADQRW